MYHFCQLQEFYGILYSKQPQIISLICNISNFWENNKSMWFSHEEVCYFPTMTTLYSDCNGFNYALLLQYDQIFRHPCNYIHENDKPFAFKFATHMALKLLHNEEFIYLNDVQKVFILLALRHNNSLKMKMLALQKAFQILHSDQCKNEKLLLRFINASILDIDKFKCNQGFMSKTDIVPNINITETSTISNNIEQNELIMLREKYNEILEEKTAIEKSFHIISNQKLLENKLINIVNNKHIKNHNKIAVSISGGVDSMVLSYIANLICKKHNKQLILLHICYNNRECCNKETNFLIDWARMLNVELYVRTIDEIKRSRNSQFRTMYEDVTRRIRFSFYKYFKCPILLGHNRDDTFENMFSNLSKGIHFDNLAGMNEIGLEDNVYILRPFLSIDKKILLSFADKMNIPHLYDSTPPWSRRGKTRDSLIPAIQHFDSNILKGLEQLTQYTKFLHQQWETQFEEWNEINVTKQHHKLIIQKDKYFKTNMKNISFWVRIWFDNELPTRPSNKSFQNLIENVSSNRIITCDMNKYYKCIITNDEVIFERKQIK